MKLLLLALQIAAFGDSHTVFPENYCDTSAHECSNHAIGDTTVAQWNANWASWGAPHIGSRDRVSFLLGTNSARGFNPVPAAAWGASMRSLLDKVEHDDIVLLSPPHAQGHNPALNGAVDSYRDEMVAIAAERENVTFGVDLSSLRLRSNHYVDAIHLSPAGYEVVRGVVDPAWGPVPVPTPGSGAQLSLALVALGVAHRRTRGCDSRTRQPKCLGR